MFPSPSSAASAQRLGIGTVQFGTTYGITNLYGQVDRATVVDILQLAKAAGVDLLDTAAMYGQAEEVLSDAMSKIPGYSVVTKSVTSAVGIDGVVDAARKSHKLLGSRSLYGLLVHSASDLKSDSGPALWSALLELRDAGLFGKLGISVYASDDVVSLAKQYRPAIVQLPVSVLDQRLVKSGVIGALKDLGVEIHVRSIFLQGILFLNTARLPIWLRHVRPALKAFHRRLKDLGISPVEAGIGFPLSIPGIDRIIVGMSSIEEAREIISATTKTFSGVPWEELSISNSVLLDPRLWVNAKQMPNKGPEEDKARPYVLAVIQARMSSTRLPGKVLKPILGRPMLGRHIDRLQRCSTIDRIIVATSVEESDDAIASFCAAESIGCYRGPLNDVLARYEGAAREYDPVDHVVRLTADCPLADPDIVDRVIDAHLTDKNSYTTNVLQQTFPNGLDVEIMTRHALRQAAAEATNPYEREHVTPFLYRRPYLFKLGNIENNEDHGQLRWTVDTEADFRMVEAVFRELLRANESFGYSDILTLLAKRPDIAAMNAASGK